jgi:hypothetical protein
MSVQTGSSDGSLLTNADYLNIGEASESRQAEAVAAIGPPAAGTITFSANPADASTITIAGTVVTFKTTPAASLDVQIGSTLALTLQNLLAVLDASGDANLVLCEYFASATVLTVVAVGAGHIGDAYTLVASTSPASHGTVSGATLTAGSQTIGKWSARILQQVVALPFPAYSASV